jgi:hypothetical protein
LKDDLQAASVLPHDQLQVAVAIDHLDGAGFRVGHIAVVSGVGDLFRLEIFNLCPFVCWLGKGSSGITRELNAGLERMKSNVPCRPRERDLASAEGRVGPV